MTESSLKTTYDILTSVYKQGGYSNIKLNDALKNIINEADKAFITFLTYGVIEKDVTLQYYIQKLTAKKPAEAVQILLKIGIYLIKYANTPVYTAINGVVDLSKQVGKSGVSGFINAVLRKAVDAELPKLGNSAYSLSVNYSCPVWIVELIVSQHGLDFAKAFLSYVPNTKTHVRPINTTVQDLVKMLEVSDADCTPLGVYLNQKQMINLPQNSFVPISYGSMLVVKTIGQCSGTALDLCAAPGGKSAYLQQLNTNLQITACDIHPHRVQLLNSYFKKLNLSIATQVNDATVYNASFASAYDIVICDVLCSGLGVVSSKPEIKLNRTLDDIIALSKIQTQILNNAAKYVKENGKILYSTCTITNQENQQVVQNFLQENKNFTLQKQEFIYPQTHNTDAFYVAILQKLAS